MPLGIIFNIASSYIGEFSDLTLVLIVLAGYLGVYRSRALYKFRLKKMDPADHIVLISGSSFAIGAAGALLGYVFGIYMQTAGISIDADQLNLAVQSSTIVLGSLNLLIGLESLRTAEKWSNLFSNQVRAASISYKLVAPWLAAFSIVLGYFSTPVIPNILGMFIWFSIAYFYLWGISYLYTSIHWFYFDLNQSKDQEEFVNERIPL